jgi:hypothetical protein
MTVLYILFTSIGAVATIFSGIVWLFEDVKRVERPPVILLTLLSISILMVGIVGLLHWW